MVSSESAHFSQEISHALYPNSRRTTCDTAVQRRAREEAQRPTRPSDCNGLLGRACSSAHRNSVMVKVEPVPVEICNSELLSPQGFCSKGSTIFAPDALSSPYEASISSANTQ